MRTTLPGVSATDGSALDDSMAVYKEVITRTDPKRIGLIGTSAGGALVLEMDPLISPIYGDMSGFPPTILTSGTRDLLLSNTVRRHRKLRNLGIDAFLQVYEGQSHAQYGRDDRISEVREAFLEIGSFLSRHLKK